MTIIYTNTVFRSVHNILALLSVDLDVIKNTFLAIGYTDNAVVFEEKTQIAAQSSGDVRGLILIYIVAIFAGLYILLKTAVAIKSVSNYSKNKNLDFPYLINGQGKGNAAKVRMGFWKGNYNGCGWIAAYNYLSILNVTVHPSIIVDSFENRGVIAGGMFGVTPNSVSRFIKRRGVKVIPEYFPDKSKIDDKVKEAKVAVLFYMHSKGAHYITVKWDSFKNRFIIYNSSNNEISPIERESLQDYLRSRRIITLHYTK
ncbi:MAG: hypothetical protein K6F76_02790 [Clostridiales bacterium]|nr:hypothetical protein [Clostridiales bacterium]